MKKDIVKKFFGVEFLQQNRLMIIAYSNARGMQHHNLHPTPPTLYLCSENEDSTLQQCIQQHNFLMTFSTFQT